MIAFEITTGTATVRAGYAARSSSHCAGIVRPAISSAVSFISEGRGNIKGFTVISFWQSWITGFS
jgi:hypothetical protein